MELEGARGGWKQCFDEVEAALKAKPQTRCTHWGFLMVYRVSWKKQPLVETPSNDLEINPQRFLLIAFLSRGQRIFVEPLP